MQKFITAKGIPVHINIAGKGNKLLIFLHGFLETQYIWDEFAPLFENDYQVLTIDLPGHGLTGSNPEENSMDFCADVIFETMKSISFDKASLIGHSMGGYAAIRFVQKYTDKCESIVLINSSPFADSQEKKVDRLREIELIKAGKILSLTALSIPKMFAESNLKKFSSKIDEIIEITEVHDPTGIIYSIMGLMSREDSLEFLKTLQIPALMVAGERDRFLNIDKIEYLKAELPNFKVVILPESGHIAFIEERDKVELVLKDFLQNLP